MSSGVKGTLPRPPSPKLSDIILPEPQQRHPAVAPPVLLEPVPILLDLEPRASTSVITHAVIGTAPTSIHTMPPELLLRTFSNATANQTESTARASAPRAAPVN